VTYDADETVTLAMDFAEVVNTGAYLSSITTVVTVDSSGSDAGVSTNSTVGTDPYRAEWNPPSLSAGGYVVTVTVATSDTETMVGTGVLQVI
jgi:predicted metal-dependent TIM-barrel fold hydrolase